MKKQLNFRCLSLTFLLLTINAVGQELEDYIIGEEQKLQIVVFIMGQVGKPGEYHISEKMDVVELISKAGGETEYSNLSKVTITRQKFSYLASSDTNFSTESSAEGKEVIIFDVRNYIRTRTGPHPPKLQAGDIVYVPTNKWRTWKTVASILRDLSFVASTYFLYLRTTN